MTPDQQLELAVYAKVYEAILTAPITSAFREDGPGSEDEAPPDDPEMVVAIRADRFGLMTRIREMRLAAALGAAPAPQCPKGDPRRAAALQRARDRTPGVAERHPRCGYPYCACVGECFAASQPGVTDGVLEPKQTDGGTR